MGDFEGVRRVFRTELNPQVERHPFLEKTDRDKKGKDHEEQPRDTVELHEETDENAEGKPPKALRPQQKDRGLDISA